MAEKVVIIGSGPAGWTAAIYAAPASLQPLVYEGSATYGPNKDNGTQPLGHLTTEVKLAGVAVRRRRLPSAPLREVGPSPRSAMTISAITTRERRRHHGKRAANGPELMEFMRQQAINFGTRIVTDDIIRVELGKPGPSVLQQSRRGCDRGPCSHPRHRGPGELTSVLPSEHRYKNEGVSACTICDGAVAATTGTNRLSSSAAATRPWRKRRI